MNTMYRNEKDTDQTLTLHSGQGVCCLATQSLHLLVYQESHYCALHIFQKVAFCLVLYTEEVKK